MRKAIFRIEIYGKSVFEGYTQDENPSDWACPLFSFEESQKVVAAHRKTGQKAEFVENLDGFFFEVQGDEEFYPVAEIKGKKFYPIGNFNWIWEQINV